jgi:hypothetical protein
MMIRKCSDGHMVCVMPIEIGMCQVTMGIYGDRKKWSCSSKRSMKAYLKGTKVFERDKDGKRRVKKTFKLKERFVEVGRGPRRWYQRSRRRCEGSCKAHNALSKVTKGY